MAYITAQIFIPREISVDNLQEAIKEVILQMPRLYEWEDTWTEVSVGRVTKNPDIKKTIEHFFEKFDIIPVAQEKGWYKFVLPGPLRSSNGSIERGLPWFRHLKGSMEKFLASDFSSRPEVLFAASLSAKINKPLLLFYIDSHAAGGNHEGWVFRDVKPVDFKATTDWRGTKYTSSGNLEDFSLWKNFFPRLPSSYWGKLSSLKPKKELLLKRGNEGAILRTFGITRADGFSDAFFRIKRKRERKAREKFVLSIVVKSKLHLPPRRKLSMVASQVSNAVEYASWLFLMTVLGLGVIFFLLISLALILTGEFIIGSIILALILLFLWARYKQIEKSVLKYGGGTFYWEQGHQGVLGKLRLFRELIYRRV